MPKNRAIQLDANRISRRHFLGAAAVSSMALTLPASVASAISRLERPVRIGVMADLHQDIMHDGVVRMQAFVEQMSEAAPDAIMQLGDFAYPNDKNRKVIQLFNDAHERSVHVIGNHDTDAGHTKQQCLDTWGMPAPYYVTNVEGLQVLVLDGNETGSPRHRGGYVSYVGEEQMSWLREQLATLEGPVIVASHQPLAGVSAVDNAEELQGILAEAADKVILAVNGHSHLDQAVRVQGVTYLHVNSASYYWVGDRFRHESYSREVHDEYPWISRTCPYRDALFATITIEPRSRTIRVDGRHSEWIGKSPAELGVDVTEGLTHGDQIVPRIQSRRFERMAR